MPLGGTEYCLGKTREMYHAMSAETAEFIDFILDNDGKALHRHCMSFRGFGCEVRLMAYLLIPLKISLKCVTNFFWAFYTVDYALAQVCALEYYRWMESDKNAAWNSYLDFCRKTGR